MFNYQQLKSACKNLGINPSIKKDLNLLLDGRPIDVYETPFDLATIGFPKQELVQVTKIGKMIYNLTSQQKFPESFNCITAKGRRELHNTNIIKNFLPTAQTSQQFWFEQGLAACKANADDFELHRNGIVYKVDYSARKEFVDLVKTESPPIPRYIPDRDSAACC